MKYTEYSYKDKLEQGKELVVNRSISLENQDLSYLLALPKEELEQKLEASQQEEENIFQQVKEVAKGWAKCAANTQAYRLALQMQDAKVPEHTHNQWEDGGGCKTRTNAVYKMSYEIYDESKYVGYKLGKKTFWYVYWNVYMRPNPLEIISAFIAGQNRKKFDTKEQAEKYLQGRIKAYDHLFQEDNPIVPKEYVHLYVCNETPFPCYRLEGINA